MAQRVCPECGHVEGEYTFFCTECGAKTVESAASEPAKMKPSTSVRTSQEEINEQSSLAYEQPEGESCHNQDVLEPNEQKSEPEVNRLGSQANQEETSKSTDKTILPAIPANYKRASIVGIIVGAIVLIALIGGLATKKPWGAKSNNNSNDTSVKTEQTEISNASYIAEETAKEQVGQDNIATAEVEAEEKTEVAANNDDENSYVSDVIDSVESMQTDASAIDDIDVESEVVSIREKYNEIVGFIQGNGCNEVDINKEVTGYISDEVNAIYVKKGYDDYGYSRKYYYDSGHLIFAYFESNDAHRLYFKNDRLFRWRYSQNAADAQNAVNHDADNADGYDALEIFAIKEAYSLLAKASNDASDKPIGTAVVNAPDGGVNLRSGPGTEYEILVSMIPNGTELKVYQLKTSSKGTQWGYAKYNGTEGWIALSQVDYSGTN